MMCKSDPFPTTMDVKQGCVLAPSLFNVFLLAVSLLACNADSDDPSSAGVKLKYRLDGGAFNLQRLRAPTKVSHVALRDLQYADDAAVVAGNPEELQCQMHKTNIGFTRLGLTMNKNKTEVMHRTMPLTEEPQAVTIDRTELPTTAEFTYLGSIISSNGTVDHKINYRISRASAAFGQLKERVYLNKNLQLCTKMKVYNAIVLTTLLYGAETWSPYASQLKTRKKKTCKQT